MTKLSANIVSSEDELLVLVDAEDNETGHMTKAECHDGAGVLHRAFSVFLFNQHGEILLQQRGADKRLWPMYWSNSCCSHPRKGESLEFATTRRLQDELNVSATLEFVYKFAYQAGFGEAGSENEMCSVFLGRLDDEPNANATEIEAMRFVPADDLNDELATTPDKFTPWLKLEWQRLSKEFAAVLAKYSAPD
ncbi:MAG: isopentenyl-diphosphate delta-isomerase [Gammaproteobacteria bacterium]|nr:MAG: isopentenyl-diphosphate delta-isomerase [Gammaproteobacteria bacterium]RLA36030.1 MAG: isopentenyl-diphosphate delta-isomerase [Gammaproteobacteria bacterium]